MATLSRPPCCLSGSASLVAFPQNLPELLSFPGRPVVGRAFPGLQTGLAGHRRASARLSLRSSRLHLLTLPHRAWVAGRFLRALQWSPYPFPDARPEEAGSGSPAEGRAVPRPPLQALGLPGTRLGLLTAGAAASPRFPNSTAENLRHANRRPQGRPENASAACACGLGGRPTAARAASLPPAAAVWSSLTAPRPADAASSRASTLSYQRWGGAPVPAAYQREPRFRRAQQARGQGAGDWAAAALGA